MNILLGFALFAVAILLSWYGQRGYLPVQGTGALPKKRFVYLRHGGRFYLHHPLKFVSLVLSGFAAVAGMNMIF
ncbi:MAG: hypothetical protein H6920_02090 [Sphingomonadaceae bacterium]|nr:hypothetical protein [Altererythrobacter sp.]MCP5390404.1 hypothetical protein [Sphingomonadaceae bacterium]MCP5393299.1 hypothetical protein [Sphingomonadaceae bacterium]